MPELYVDCPSYIMSDPGFYQDVSLWEQSSYLQSNSTTDPGFIYEDISHTIIQKPLPITTSLASVSTLWNVTGNLVTISSPDIGGGVQITTQGPWSIETKSNVTEYGRGFIIDLMVFENASNAYNQSPISIYWGGQTNYSGYKYCIMISGNEKGIGSAEVWEYNQDYSSGTEIKEWLSLGKFTLISGNFFNMQHRIWFEPLSYNKFLIRNMLANQGMVFYTQYPEIISTTNNKATESNGQSSTINVYAPWDKSKISMNGYSPAVVTYRNLEYKTSTYLYTQQFQELGFTTTKGMDTDLRWITGDLKDEDESDYSAELIVLNEDDDVWTEGTGGSEFVYYIVLSSTDNGTTSGYSLRSSKLSSLRLKIEPTVTTDSLTPIDLFSSNCVMDVSLHETDSNKDNDMTFSVKVTSNPSWCYPGNHVKLLPYDNIIRFEGYIADITYETLVDHATDTEYYHLHIHCRNMWKDAEESLFLGSYSLDSMMRSDVYSLLAEQMGLPSSLVSIGTLSYNTTLPDGINGEKQSLMPKIGTPIIEIFDDVQKYYSATDQIYFRDKGEGTKLYITDETYTNTGTFYMTSEEAVNAGYPERVIIGKPGSSLINLSLNDKDFSNDITVIGGNPNNPDGAVKAVYRSYDWLDPTSPKYNHGKPRTLVVVSDAWRTQADVNLVGYILYNKFNKYTEPYEFDSILSEYVYPNDYVSVYNSISSATVSGRIKSITTNLNMNMPTDRLWTSKYEIETAL
jgi:hypothetical protein